jgi:Sulfotransferase family
LVPGSSPGRPTLEHSHTSIRSAVISHKHKCIFVEVPTTGSTSVRGILGKAWKPHLNLWQIKQLMETSWTEFGGRKNRIMAALYLLQPQERRRESGRRQFESYFKFGFVRNPWDRVVSLYERTEALQLRNEMSFEQFVDWIQYSSATCVHSSPHRYQLDWFVDANGNLLADFIGKFERLDEDWAFVAQKLGVEERLPHRRPNPRSRHYTEYYTPRTRDIIAAKFKVDIERFDYEFAG